MSKNQSNKQGHLEADQKELQTSMAPSVSLNGHYIKKLDIDNTNSPDSFAPQKDNPKIEVSVNFNNRVIQDNVYEVYLTIKARARSDESNLDLFDIKLIYAGLTTLTNVSNDNQKEEILMIYLPNLLFPYARRVISDATRDSGFQPLFLEHIDFASLYNKRKKEQGEVI